MLDYCVIIPAHNEAQYISYLLDSLTKQSLLPRQAVIVNDNSTDQTASIIDRYANDFPWITKVNSQTEASRLPGSKVVAAFEKGMEEINQPFDFIVKLDADLILPLDYFEKISGFFQTSPNAGIIGGFAYEKEGDQWKLNHPMGNDHVRGAFKAYRKACFDKMNGLRCSIGWDTMDELLARYHGFEVITVPELKVKHLRPTGSSYSKKAKYMQGQAMYKMRYGFGIAFLSMAKVSWKQQKPRYLWDSMIGYITSFFDKTERAVTKDEGKFIRSYRWKNIFQKISGK
ncbi:glycosyltransferase family 2 protein [Echinicola strongylocentroti]|uniref:Glycosyltransferase family 2 protein n=1 Tax=Echinicola strongylocentroti TaxID=1795355 RepID=A0A2Z4IEM7_9BACT|nr:glycosyltransferase family 2 protein [Echinicola strongylocentroti]AWW29127.1 glycosyltransferase family 2 protein [Echinicola strongylocentroti]